MPTVWTWCFAVLLAIATSLRAEDKLPARPCFARPHLADYNSELRGPGRRVDVDLMVKRLKDLGITTYYWLVSHAATDWDDLQLFLSKAAEARIDVWVYLAPPGNPTDTRARYSEPFRQDYVRWGEEIARLSIKHANLTGWVIDDFYSKHRFFTPDYVRAFQTAAKAINPRLLFLPLLYYREISHKFVGDYRGVIDGVVVAYLEDRSEIERTWAILNDGTIFPASEFSLTPNTGSRPGDYVMASQSLKVFSTDRHELEFLEQDSIPGTSTGYHYKQLLVDGSVVWEEDVAGGSSGWRKVVVNVTEQVRGKTSAVIGFRLLDKKRVSNFPVRWRVKDLRGNGLQLLADLREPQKWKVSRRGTFETGFGNPKPGQRQFHIPFVSMTAASAGEFGVRHGNPATPERITRQLQISLDALREGKCDGVVTYCLDKRPESLTFSMAQKLFRGFGSATSQRR